MSKKQETSSEDFQENQYDSDSIESVDAIEAEGGVQEEQVIPTLEDELKEANDKFLRLYAEFENFRKRTNKEKVDLLSHASAGVLKDILPVMDDFERAINNNEKVEDPTLLKEGFQLIYTKLKGIMEAKGVKAMVTKGEAFDSEVHEAIVNVPAPSDDLKGKIIDDVEKGYYLNDKVIRFAKVVVGQ